MKTVEAYIRYSVLNRPCDAVGELREFRGDTARCVIEAMERLKGGRLIISDVIAACRVHEFYIPRGRQ